LCDLNSLKRYVECSQPISTIALLNFRAQLTTALGEVPDTEASARDVPPELPAASFLGPSPQFIVPSSSLYFSGDSRKTSILHYLPSQNVANGLIAQYWAAVHPMIRIVHRPTFERKYDYFWKDVQAGNQPPNSLQALVLAAMLSAVLSLTEEEVISQFGVAKNDLVANFMRGTEAALARANFLRTTKLETMQALVAYLVSK
jgi:hypothetical protein